MLSEREQEMQGALSDPEEETQEAPLDPGVETEDEAGPAAGFGKQVVPTLRKLTISSNLSTII